MKDYTGLDCLFEAGFFDFDAVDARREIGENIFARGAGEDGITEIRGGVDGGDSCIGDHGFGGVGDTTGERGIGGLGAQKRGEASEDKGNVRDFEHRFKPPELVLKGISLG